MATRAVTLPRPTLRLPFRAPPAIQIPPDRFDLVLTLDGHERRVRWDGRRVRLDPPSRTAPDAFRPSPLEWERFWRAVDRLGVWQWADGFERGREGEPTWSLELVLRNRRLRTAGFEAYPPLAEGPEPTPVFAAFCAAVSRLVGDRLV